MASILDYTDWIGDIPLGSYPLTEVDALVFATLTYVHFDEKSIPGSIKELAASFLKRGSREVEEEFRVRVANDCLLLGKLASSERFSSVSVTRGRDIFSASDEIQFSAFTFLLPDGVRVVAYRGTDNTVTGWKEDFNMSFSEEIPAQREALRYLEEEAAAADGKLVITGHSKGGNLALYASAKADKAVRDRIVSIYNFDGPGFLPAFLESEGYNEITDRIHTYVPKSSIIGMLLDRREMHTIVDSRQIGIYQHDPYSWQVMGVHFVKADELSKSASLFDQSLKSWLSSIPAEKRSLFIDEVFSWLSNADVSRPFELKHPKALLSFFTSMRDADPELKRNMLSALKAFFSVSAANIKDVLKKDSAEGRQLIDQH